MKTFVRSNKLRLHRFSCCFFNSCFKHCEYVTFILTSFVVYFRIKRRLRFVLLKSRFYHFNAHTLTFLSWYKCWCIVFFVCWFFFPSSSLRAVIIVMYVNYSWYIWKLQKLYSDVCFCLSISITDRNNSIPHGEIKKIVCTVFAAYFIDSLSLNFAIVTHMYLLSQQRGIYSSYFKYRSLRRNVWNKKHNLFQGQNILLILKKVLTRVTRRNK